MHCRLLIIQSGLTSLCFVDDLCQILGMFSLNSIGCVIKCGPAGISGGKYSRQMYMESQRAQISLYERFEVIFLNGTDERETGIDKMNKEQSADDPSVDLIRCKKRT